MKRKRSVFGKIIDVFLVLLLIALLGAAVFFGMRYFYESQGYFSTFFEMIGMADETLFLGDEDEFAEDIPGADLESVEPVLEAEPETEETTVTAVSSDGREGILSPDGRYVFGFDTFDGMDEADIDHKELFIHGSVYTSDGVIASADWLDKLDAYDTAVSHCEETKAFYGEKDSEGAMRNCRIICNL